MGSAPMKPVVRVKAGGMAFPGAAPAQRSQPQMRYLRDVGSGILGARRVSLPDSRESIRWAWERAAALAEDFIQNSGRLKGAVDQVLADTVGTELKLNFQPDLAGLGYDDKERAEFKTLVERRWRQWAWNPQECDLRGKFTLPQMVDISLRHFIAYGEACGALDFMPEARRRQYGVRSGLKVCSTSPINLVRDTREFEGLYQGVIHDAGGRPSHYRVRSRRDGMMETVDYRARDPFGMALFYHVFDPKDSADVRGISELAPVMKTWAMSEKLDDLTLQSLALQTVFAATITSPEPSDTAFNAIAALGDMTGDLGSAGTSLGKEYLAYFGAQLDAAAERRVTVSDAGQVNHLAPGEEFEMHKPVTPGDQYLPLSMNLQRILARCIGVTYSSFTLNHENATYSSVRMENASIWPVVMRRRERIAAPVCNAVFEPWLAEEIVEGRIPFKGGARAFMANRERASWAEWVGPPAPTADDLKSARAATERLGNRTSSLAIESAATGYDPQDIAAMRAADIELYEGYQMGDPYLPTFAAMSRPVVEADDPAPAPARKS
ncbi:portal protein [Aurantimonas phage AmM-1]|uniref:portal protein n=1 Tax=Aurantimonas phage AmM-1 TaxID=1503929 RepID=UPI0005410233|nr:portal protein [Aurantimonas phage AmM-1]BAP94460.1 portal protein [Aurantimonas phage AmM-1]